MNDGKNIKKISKNSRVVIYTQMNGRVGQINLIKKICKENNLILIEDSAHAIGSYNNNIHVGNSGIAGSFSFSMPKLITMGQGGAVITNNDKLAKKHLNILTSILDNPNNGKWVEYFDKVVPKQDMFELKNFYSNYKFAEQTPRYI